MTDVNERVTGVNEGVTDGKNRGGDSFARGHFAGEIFATLEIPKAQSPIRMPE